MMKSVSKYVDFHVQLVFIVFKMLTTSDELFLGTEITHSQLVLYVRNSIVTGVIF